MKTKYRLLAWLLFLAIVAWFAFSCKRQSNVDKANVMEMTAMFATTPIVHYKMNPSEIVTYKRGKTFYVDGFKSGKKVTSLSWREDFKMDGYYEFGDSVYQTIDAWHLGRIKGSFMILDSSGKAMPFQTLTLWYMESPPEYNGYRIWIEGTMDTTGVWYGYGGLHGDMTVYSSLFKTIL